MSLSLSNLKPAKGSVKKRKKVGRGGKRGTYSGRGLKGQRSRSGGKSGLKALGFKQTLQRIPKKRGFKSLKPKVQVVNLSDLEKVFSDGDIINAKNMFAVGLIVDHKKAVKVLGQGKLTKKLIIIADFYSQSAKDAIEKQGGEARVVSKED